MSAWLVAGCAAVAAALVVPGRPRLPSGAQVRGAPRDDGWMLRYRWLWALLAGLGAATFVQGTAGVVVGVVAAGTAWVVIGRAETPRSRRDREAVRRELPHVVTLFAATLRAGAAPGDGLALVAAALPGPAAARLQAVAARLELGVDPVLVWEALAGDPELARLGRAMARAQATGAPVVAGVERLADELAAARRGDTEDKARAVGVKAALPLGLCLLPAFVLIGIVPLVAGLLTSLRI